MDNKNHYDETTEALGRAFLKYPDLSENWTRADVMALAFKVIPVNAEMAREIKEKADGYRVRE